MIKQSHIGLASRTLANLFNTDGFLPLITAPMSSVVDESNYQIFWENNINICFPRTANMDEVHNDPCYKDSFHAISLDTFIATYIDNSKPIGSRPHKRCIDTANGNIPQLHEAIREAKKIHGDNLIIMAGNVASVEAFVELAETGVDYIRVGIGGGGGCNTTSNTSVGNPFGNLEYLIEQCSIQIQKYKGIVEKYHKNWNRENSKPKVSKEEYFGKDYTTWYNVSKVKIVADGISSYVDYCQKEYGFNDNGYAAINKLLFAGADLVMVGKLFAQCLESAGEKAYRDLNGGLISKQEMINSHNEYYKDISNLVEKDIVSPPFDETQYSFMMVKYSGMSTQEEQRKYRTGELIHGSSKEGKAGIYRINIKPSEGSVNWIPVRWTLDEWLSGSQNQDTYPYLMGWVNSIKSAMAYAGKTTLNGTT